MQQSPLSRLITGRKFQFPVDRPLDDIINYIERRRLVPFWVYLKIDQHSMNRDHCQYVFTDWHYTRGSQIIVNLIRDPESPHITTVTGQARFTMRLLIVVIIVLVILITLLFTDVERIILAVAFIIVVIGLIVESILQDRLASRIMDELNLPPA